MEGDDGGSQAGDRAVGAVGSERNLRKREVVALSMRPLYRTAATPSPLPPQSLPLRRMLCFSTPGKVNFPAKAALAVGRRREALQWGGGWAAVPLPPSKAVNGRLPAVK